MLKFPTLLNMVASDRIELSTNALSRHCSTTELRSNKLVENMGIKPIDNCLQGSQELQLNHSPNFMADLKGIEPS